MPVFAWLAFCSFAGAFRRQRARRLKRSSGPWQVEWYSSDFLTGKGQKSPVRPTRMVSEFTSAERLLQPATSADSFFRLIVALLIIGRAQKPTLRRNPKVT